MSSQDTRPNQRFASRGPFTPDEIETLRSRRVVTPGRMQGREGLDADGVYWDPRDSHHIMDIVPGLRAVFTNDHSTIPHWRSHLEVFAPDHPYGTRAGWAHLRCYPLVDAYGADTLRYNRSQLRAWLMSNALSPEALLAGTLTRLALIQRRFDAHAQAGAVGLWGTDTDVGAYQSVVCGVRADAALLGVTPPSVPELDRSALADRSDAHDDVQDVLAATRTQLEAASSASPRPFSELAPLIR